jgi:antitoxin component YwqK of YwqJK toxin-antitoxin module
LQQFKENKADKETATQQNNNNQNWTDSFLELQKAIATGDSEALKSFFEFPIQNKGNEIWYYADSRLVTEIKPKDIKPFTEADFDLYFNSIFSIDLRRTISKLDIESFFKNNKGSSPEIEVVENTKSKLEARFDNKKNKLTLSLITTVRPDLALTTHFEFEITASQKIKFLQLHVEDF